MSKTKNLVATKVPIAPEKEGLVLSEFDWEEELDKLAKTKRFPIELARMLKNLISATQKNAITPESTRYLVDLIHIHVPKGLWIGEKMYQPAHYIPDDKALGRSFFILIPAYPRGVIQLLCDSTPKRRPYVLRNKGVTA